MRVISVREYALLKGAQFEDVEVASADDLVEKNGKRFSASFCHGALTVARLENIRFYKSHGLVVTEEGWILSDTTLDEYSRTISGMLELGRIKLSNNFSMIVDEPAAVIGGQQNFYHWMFNWLSKFTALHGSNFWEKVESIILNGPLERFQWESLFKLGIGAGKNMHIAQGHDPVLVKDAIVPTLFTNPIHSRGHIDWLRSLHSSTLVVDGVGDKIYISRKDAAKGNRQILNENLLIEILKKYGFSVVRLGDLSLKEQASVFRSAKYVIAPHGAGLSNVIHSEPGAFFLELQARDAYTQVFWSLGLLSKAARYDILACDSFGDFIPYQKHIEVDLVRLESILAEKWGLSRCV
ncbi:glycosyltransferase family 61 protein [Pseudomonas sp. Marseille-P8916]|uniref:glycosyltransferase family 61 protein n=1 Tax=Pseudomonas sp. Marseille-P8916 TaxID=2866589 RepID=UPI001CE498C6|nr:glycosyltransferase family 61 protein [Pseudomonas sp. Marseille-P8916]